MMTSQHKKGLNFVTAFLLAVFLFLAPGILLADTTTTLRPNADGGGDSADWTNTTGTACNTEDCSSAVIETSGASCTNSDGDTTFVSSIVSGANQTFNLAGSSIPNSATITGLSVTACYKWQGGGATAPTFETRVCLDNTCSNSGTTITGSASYAETTQTHTVNFRKTSTSDVEIGMAKTNTKNLRVSQISAVITYTPDTTAPAAVSNLATSNATASSIDLSWTAPGNDGSTGTATSYDIRYSIATTTTDSNWSAATQVTGEPTPQVAGTSQTMTVSGLTAATTYFFAMKVSDEVPNESSLSNVPSLATAAAGSGGGGGGGSGGSAPTSVIFSGQAYPNSKIEVLRKSRQDEIYKNIPAEFSRISDDGIFYISYTGLLGGDYLFALRAEDKDGRKTGVMSFGQDLLGSDRLEAKDIFFPPTIDIDKELVIKGSEIKVVGYGAPQNKIELDIGGILKGVVTSDKTGYYVFATSTASLKPGEYAVKARQIDKTGRTSDFSPTTTFRISTLAVPKADFNNDNTVNTTDWSVFLFRWGSKDDKLRSKIDMDGDGKISIADLSIFLSAIKIK